MCVEKKRLEVYSWSGTIDTFWTSACSSLCASKHTHDRNEDGSGSGSGSGGEASRRTAVLVVGEEERHAAQARVVRGRERERVPATVRVAGPAVLVQARWRGPEAAVALHAPRARGASRASGDYARITQRQRNGW